MLFTFFYRIKSIIFPISKDEKKIFLPLSCLMFCILFNFGALRSLKDSLVVPTMGAEVISFLKLWLVLPFTIIFTIIYVKLSNSFDVEYIFYIIIAIFIFYLMLFAFVLFPNYEYYHLNHALSKKLYFQFPNLKWFISIAENWSYAVMYILSELWSVIVISLMFWQLANNIFNINQAKRIYPILGIIGNLGIVVSGIVLIYFSNKLNFSNEYNAKEYHIFCEHMLKVIILSVVASSILSIFLFKKINEMTISKDTMSNSVVQNRTKLSVLQSIKLVINSSYIRNITILVLCYGLVINILEVSWKAKVCLLYPTTLDYINFMGKFNIYTGVSSVLFMIICSPIIRNVNWFFAAILTPMMLLITGCIFFIFIIFSKYFDYNLVYIAVLVGTIQNSLTKAAKYSLFDPTKEMLYIPLSVELKTKGKASVELIGNKLGKSLGALIHSIIFLLFTNSTFDSIGGMLFIIFIITILIWFFNINKLYLQYKNIIDKY